MAVSYIGYAGNTGTSVTIPTHQVGDWLLVFAYNDSSNTVPTLPSGWTSIIGSGANNNAVRLAFKVATATNDSSGTWTNAYSVECQVYRDATIGASAVGGGTTTTLQFPALTLQNTDSTSWVARFGGNVDNNSLSSGTLSGYTKRSSTDTGGYTVGFDSNGTLGSSPAAANLSGESPQTAWRAVSVEIKVATTPVVVTPGPAALTLTGSVPVLDTGVRPGPASLTLTGGTPVLDTAARPGPATLTLTGGTPTVTVTAPGTVIPGPATLTLTGGTPTVLTPRTVTPGAASLTLTGGTPVVTTGVVVTPGPAALALTGGTPAVVVELDQLWQPFRPFGIARPRGWAVGPQAVIVDTAAACTAAAIPPIVSVLLPITASPAAATTGCLAPTLLNYDIRNISVIPAGADAAAIPPRVSANQAITAPVAAASGDAIVPVVSITAAGYDDDFNRADGTTLGTKWTTKFGTMGISSNAAYSVNSVSNWSAAIYKTAMNGNDMSVTIKLGAYVGFDGVGVVLGANSSGTFAVGWWDGATAYIGTTDENWDINSGGLTVQIYGDADLSVGNTLTLSRTGNVYTLLKNNASLGITWPDTSNVVPRNSNQRFAGIVAASDSGSYRRIDSWSVN